MVRRRKRQLKQRQQQHWRRRKRAEGAETEAVGSAQDENEAVQACCMQIAVTTRNPLVEAVVSTIVCAADPQKLQVTAHLLH